VTEEVIEEAIAEDTVAIVAEEDLQEEVQYDAEVLTEEEAFRGQDLIREEGGEAEVILRRGPVHLRRRGGVFLVLRAGVEADHTVDRGHPNQRRPRRSCSLQSQE